MVEVASSKNATLGAFALPEQSEGARRAQSPEAMAIEGNLAGPTKFLSRCFYSILFFFFAESSRVVANFCYRALAHGQNRRDRRGSACVIERLCG